MVTVKITGKDSVVTYACMLSISFYMWRCVQKGIFGCIQQTNLTAAFALSKLIRNKYQLFKLFIAQFSKIVLAISETPTRLRNRELILSLCF